MHKCGFASGQLCSFLPLTNPTTGGLAGCYTDNFVEISRVNYQNETFSTVTMRREGDRVKAKYFAARDFNGNSVHKRFLEWQRNNPNVILLSAGTYMTNNKKPEGLTVDNGVVVNQALVHDKMDALVIVYATGGIAVSDLKLGDLSVSGIGRRLNLRKSAQDLDDFIEWAKEQEATVFQTHLLVYKNEIKVGQYNSSKTSRERRFLAVGKDEDGRLVHVIVHLPGNNSLYDGSEKVFKFLKEFRDMDITFMVNLDTGAQDVFELHNADCSINQTIKGQTPPSDAVNLLVYHFK